MSQYKVVGVKRWSGTLDGKAIDSAKIFVEVRLDGSRNGDANGASQFAGGMATEEIKVPSDQLRAVEKTPLPFMVELDTERVSNGKVARDVVIAMRLVKAQLKAA